MRDKLRSAMEEVGSAEGLVAEFGDSKQRGYVKFSLQAACARSAS